MKSNPGRFFEDFCLGEAIAQFQQALQINPGDPQVRANLERALRTASARR